MAIVANTAWGGTRLSGSRAIHLRYRRRYSGDGLWILRPLHRLQPKRDGLECRAPRVTGWLPPDERLFAEHGIQPKRASRSSPKRSYLLGVVQMVSGSSVEGGTFSAGNQQHALTSLRPSSRVSYFGVRMLQPESPRLLSEMALNFQIADAITSTGSPVRT